MRNIGCSDCRAVTSGDCGKHGPVFITTAAYFPVAVASGGYVPSELDILRGRIAVLEEQVRKLADGSSQATPKEAVLEREER